MLNDIAVYERFIYSITEKYPLIQKSTLVLIPHGPAFGELMGTLIFDKDITLSVWEDIDFNSGTLQGYSYSVNKGSERLYWYDPQPHPNNPELASTHPHHKHIPPNIKRNRIPAPGLSFDAPNLPFLIEEVQSLYFE